MHPLRTCELANVLDLSLGRRRRLVCVCVNVQSIRKSGNGVDEASSSDLGLEQVDFRTTCGPMTAFTSAKTAVRPVSLSSTLTTTGVSRHPSEALYILNLSARESSESTLRRLAFSARRSSKRRSLWLDSLSNTRSPQSSYRRTKFLASFSAWKGKFHRSCRKTEPNAL